MQSTVNTPIGGSIPLDASFLKNRVFGRVWFMALVLKTRTPLLSREFESHSARLKVYVLINNAYVGRCILFQ